jgi:hypothetical protein
MEGIFSRKIKRLGSIKHSVEFMLQGEIMGQNSPPKSTAFLYWSLHGFAVSPTNSYATTTSFSINQEAC